MSIADLNNANLDLNVHSLTLNNQNSNTSLSIYRTFTIDVTVTGPYPTSQLTTATIIQMDNKLSISMPGVIANTTVTTNTITLTGAAPFPKPVRDLYFPVVIFSTNVNNNTPLIGWGLLSSSTGIITINTVLPTTTYFGNSGYESFCLNYNYN
jgi:hypothetical protein